jgi:hypothetical protein
MVVLIDNSMYCQHFDEGFVLAFFDLSLPGILSWRVLKSSPSSELIKNRIGAGKVVQVVEHL